VHNYSGRRFGKKSCSCVDFHCVCSSSIVSWKVSSLPQLKFNSLSSSRPSKHRRMKLITTACLLVSLPSLTNSQSIELVDGEIDGDVNRKSATASASCEDAETNVPTNWEGIEVTTTTASNSNCYFPAFEPFSTSTTSELPPSQTPPSLAPTAHFTTATEKAPENISGLLALFHDVATTFVAVAIRLVFAVGSDDESPDGEIPRRLHLSKNDYRYRGQLDRNPLWTNLYL